MTKKVYSEVSWQKHLLMCIISADAANFYARAHAIMALISLGVGVHSGTIVAMLQSIQLMIFPLRTGWCESSSFIVGDAL